MLLSRLKPSTRPQYFPKAASQDFGSIESSFKAARNEKPEQDSVGILLYIKCLPRGNEDSLHIRDVELRDLARTFPFWHLIQSLLLNFMTGTIFSAIMSM